MNKICARTKGRKIYFISLIISFLAQGAYSQIEDSKINPLLLRNSWTARWITHPTAPATEYGVFHFRRTIDLKNKPEDFIVHVSADNRYRLYVNGKEIGKGPARGDLGHWRYETYDLAPHLAGGNNVIAAEVWNFGPHIPLAQITFQTAFILQGNTEKEQVLDTGNDWLVYQNKAYSPIPFGPIEFRAYYVVGPGDHVESEKYPWGWQEPQYNDGNWQKVKTIGRGAPFGISGDSQWQLIPRPIPFYGRICRKNTQNCQDKSFQCS